MRRPEVGRGTGRTARLADGTERKPDGSEGVTIDTERQSVLGRLLHDRLAVVGFVIVTFFALIALLAPYLAPHDPAEIDVINKFAGSSWDHLLGTDNLGRDNLSRLMIGARWSLAASLIATLLVMVLGIGIGVIAGYFGGLLDAVLMRLVDVLLGFPNLILALAIVGTLGPGMRHVVLGLVAVWWVDYARIVRGLVLSYREREFVTAAVSLGADDLRIIRTHILPNVVPPVIVLASLELGSLLLAISALSFLGLGVQPPTPEWGSMLNQGRLFLFDAPELMIYPGLAITLAVLGFNLIGDGLRDSLDPNTEL